MDDREPEFTPRPRQQEVLEYSRGRMGVAAVPGSGKTWTLSCLAAQLIASGELADDQEVLVVTLVNSAVDNFGGRISRFLSDRRLLPGMGYRVRTLHGLAHDIVRERPGLVGLSEDFRIADEREAQRLLDEAVGAWRRAHPELLEQYLHEETVDDVKIQGIRESPRLWPAVLREMALAFARRAKDLDLTPGDLRRKLSSQSLGSDNLALARMGIEVYESYQRALTYLGSVDFDDLIRLARRALQLDASLLERLRRRWPYILEDEAQDSNRMQEKILALLAGPEGNWVRVGDPNQAVYATFTNASPEFLLQFLDDERVLRRELLNSGRSTCSIIRLANQLVDWVSGEHPSETARKSALRRQYIERTPPGDHQPNPEDDPKGIHFESHRQPTPDAEIQFIVRSLEEWYRDGASGSVAVLVPRNQRGAQVAEALTKKGIPYVELLRSTSGTRHASGALTLVLRALADPTNARHLERAFNVWRRGDRADPGREATKRRALRRLKQLPRIEEYLWPRLGRDWLAALREEGLCERDPQLYELLDGYKDIMRRWQSASQLPIDQLVLTLAQDLFAEPTELALAHKLAILLLQAQEANPQWGLWELSQELATIAKNQRRFLGFEKNDSGFEPPSGEVTVATMHKAKGLEWDRVYLMALNNYNFPSGEPLDSYFAEKWYIRDKLDLTAEILAQLDRLSGELTVYVEGDATYEAQKELICERLRLLYVGITRAKRELFLSWNNGRKGKNIPARPFDALQRFWSGEVK